LKLKSPTALSFFEMRRFELPAPHFEYILLPTRYNLDKSLVKWIEHNLKGCFYVGKTIAVNNSNGIENMTKVGFEEAKELSYFTLACPHLKYN
jgi:hypothetical protein|tara:strand:- start:228 stop:506 length:279 start_codon:yes stop_codon:yes gene_type:complete